MSNATLELVLTVVVIGGLGAVSATRFALSVVMLTDPRQPWPRALGFAMGSTAVFTAAVLLEHGRPSTARRAGGTVRR